MDRALKKLSVIMPVLNEGAGINRLINYLRTALPDGQAEIIVVDGDPGGSTLKAVTDPLVIKHTAPRGRSFQMNEGARRARGDILLFLHADTFPPETAYRDIMAAMEKESVGAGAFRLGFPSRRWHYLLISFFANLRSRLSAIPFGDQGIFVRRRLFEKIGGYAGIPLMEDIDIMRRIKKTGAVVTILPSTVRTSTRRWEREGPLYTTLRNYALQLFYYLGVPPHRLARYYYPDDGANHRSTGPMPWSSKEAVYKDGENRRAECGRQDREYGRNGATS